MDWSCGSSGRVPALQAQSPDFKLQAQQQQIYMYLCIYIHIHKISISEKIFQKLVKLGKRIGKLGHKNGGKNFTLCPLYLLNF
jgi:hypothetical protein